MTTSNFKTTILVDNSLALQIAHIGGEHFDERTKLVRFELGIVKFVQVRIIASIFFVPLVLLTVQPVLYTPQSVSKMQCCVKMKCAKKKRQSKKSDKCENNGCNPFMACAYGNFYMNNKSIGISIMLEIKSERIVAANDNSLATCSSDCWHPPEFA
jgi:hypothetical protein